MTGRLLRAAARARIERARAVPPPAPPAPARPPSRPARAAGHLDRAERLVAGITRAVAAGPVNAPAEALAAAEGRDWAALTETGRDWYRQLAAAAITAAARP